MELLDPPADDLPEPAAGPPIESDPSESSSSPGYDRAPAGRPSWEPL